MAGHYSQTISATLPVKRFDRTDLVARIDIISSDSVDAEHSETINSPPDCLQSHRSTVCRPDIIHKKRE